MEVSEVEVFLAYRQAKNAIYQEQRGFGRIELARAEERLPQLVTSLRRHLHRTDRWFTGIHLGQLWLLPKKAAPEAIRSGVVNIGGDYLSRVERLTVRP